MPTDHRVLPSVLDIESDHELLASALAHASRAVQLRRLGSSLRTLTAGQRALAPLWISLATIRSGGLFRYYGTDVSDLFASTVAGLKQIGARKSAALLEASLWIFPGGRLPRSEQRRARLLHAAPASAVAGLDEATARFHRLIDGEILPRAAAFVRARPSEFVRPAARSPEKVVRTLSDIVGRAASRGRPPHLGALAMFGAPRELVDLYRTIDWPGGWITTGDARLLDLESIIRLNRKSDPARRVLAAGFVVIGDASAERHLYAIATASQKRMPPGSVWLFSSRRGLYETPEWDAAAQPVAPDLGAFIESFLKGKLGRRERVSKPSKRRSAVWRRARG